MKKSITLSKRKRTGKGKGTLNKKSKTQKLWKMKGCYTLRKKSQTKMNKRGGKGCSCGLFKGGGKGCGCGLFKGGGKGCSCGLFKGGEKGCGCGLFKGGNSIAVGNLGIPWTSQVSSWPGVAGLDGQSNFLPLNTYKVDPQTAMLSERDGQLGPASLTNTPIPHQTAGSNGKHGKRTRTRTRTRTRRMKKGGTALLQGLVNAGRNVMYGLGSSYNAAQGYPAPVNPKPYMDQFPNSKTTI